METFTAATGIAADNTDTGLIHRALADTKGKIHAYAVEAWLACFPGFVNDLALCLHGYTASLCSAETAYTVSLLEGEPANHHRPYWRLMTQFWSSHANREISDSNFQWYDAHTCLAITELDVPLAPLSPEPMEEDTALASSAMVVAARSSLSLPTIQTLSSLVKSEGSTFECTVVVAHPRPCIVTSAASAPDVGVSRMACTCQSPAAVGYICVHTICFSAGALLTFL
jgi:hypothetical protein